MVVVGIVFVFVQSGSSCGNCGSSGTCGSCRSDGEGLCYLW